VSELLLLALSSTAILVGAAGFGLAMRARGTLFTLAAIGLLAWGACVGIVGFAGAVIADLTPFTLAALALCFGLGGMLAAWRSGSLPTIPERLRAAAASLRRLAGWPPIAAGLVFVGLALAWRAFLVFRLPVVDVLGWQYHLVLADVWVQSEAIVRVSQNVWTDGWPATGELLTAWFMTFTHSDRLAGLTGLVPLPLAIVACAGLARELGASARTATLAGLLLGMTPAWLALAGTSYPDPGFAAAVVAAWWLGLRILRHDGSTSAGLLLGIAAGLALGIKGSGLVLIGPILGAVGAVTLWRLAGAARRGGRWWQPLAVGLGVLAPLVLLGLAWYIRNLVIHGNPLYPVGFGPFPGLESGEYGAPPLPDALAELDGIGRIVASWIHDWQLSEYLYNVRPGGFGHAWPAGIALAAVGIGLLLRRRRVKPLVFVVVPVTLGIALLYSPWYARYTLFLPAVGWAVAALALDRMGSTLRTAAGLVLVGVAGISVVLANALPNIRLDLPTGGGERFAAYVGLVFTGDQEERTEVVLRDVCKRMEQIPPGARVAVAHAIFVPHAVVGAKLDRTLVQPPPGDADSIGQLQAYLRRHDVDWLVTRADTRLNQLVADHPRHFAGGEHSCHASRIWEVRRGPET
jgi:hypothetical protein